MLTQTLDLESQLRATPDLATLAIYADMLIDKGDPRGDQIAIELRTAQRHPLLLRWLASHLRQGQVPGGDHLYATDESSIPFLDSPIGEFCRGVTGRMKNPRALLAAVTRKPRPFMTQLTLDWSDGQLVLDDSHVRAMPNLTELHLDGDVDMRAFRHRHVKQLTRSALCGGLASWPLQMDLPLCSELVVNLNHWNWIKTVKPRDVTFEGLPALRMLDVSAGEPQFIPKDDRKVRTNLNVLEWLAQLPLITRLERLRVPSIRTSADMKALQTLILRAPNLEIDVVRMYTRCRSGEELASHRVHFPTPWPWLPANMEHEHWAYELLVPGATPFRMMSAAISTGLERVFAERDEAFREDWRTIWRVIDACEKKPQQLPIGLLARGFRGFFRDLSVKTFDSSELLRDEVLALESRLEPNQLVTIQPEVRTTDSLFLTALSYAVPTPRRWRRVRIGR